MSICLAENIIEVQRYSTEFLKWVGQHRYYYDVTSGKWGKLFTNPLTMPEYLTEEELFRRYFNQQYNG